MAASSLLLSRAASVRRFFVRRLVAQVGDQVGLGLGQAGEKVVVERRLIGVAAGEQLMQRVHFNPGTVREMAVEQAGQLALLEFGLLCQALGLRREFLDLGLDAAALIGQLSQLAVCVGYRRFGLAQLVGRLGLRFLALGEIAAHGLDALAHLALLFLEFRLPGRRSSRHGRGGRGGQRPHDGGVDGGRQTKAADGAPTWPCLDWQPRPSPS